jgi:hypothetical protein
LIPHNKQARHEKPRVEGPGRSCRETLEERGNAWIWMVSEVLEQFDRVDADIFHCACVNMIAGQRIAAPVAAQQALRRLQNGSGEAGMVLPGHLCVPSRRDVLVVLMTATLHRREPSNVRFITLRARLSCPQSRFVNRWNRLVLGKCDRNVFVTWRNLLTVIEVLISS